MSTKNKLINKLIKNYNEIFEKRPGMLGKSYEIDGMFHLLDQLEFIQKYDKEMDSNYSWHSYLIEKKHIVQAHDHLSKKLLESPDDYSLLQSLRGDYKDWLEEKISQ